MKDTLVVVFKWRAFCKRCSLYRECEERNKPEEAFKCFMYDTFHDEYRRPEYFIDEFISIRETRNAKNRKRGR